MRLGCVQSKARANETMSGPVVECVPNFSEGKDARRVEAIVAAMRVEGVHLLDWSMDADHNRSLVTLAGEPAAMVEAAVRGVGKAVELINLTRQEGAHPRIGAADVIPFVPISGIKLEQCALLARQTGQEIWRRFGVPVFFYGAAAARPDRAKVEEVRRMRRDRRARLLPMESWIRHWGACCCSPKITRSCARATSSCACKTSCRGQRTASAWRANAITTRCASTTRLCASSPTASGPALQDFTRTTRFSRRPKQRALLRLSSSKRLIGKLRQNRKVVAGELKDYPATALFAIQRE